MLCICPLHVLTPPPHTHTHLLLSCLKLTSFCIPLVYNHCVNSHNPTPAPLALNVSVGICRAVLSPPPPPISEPPVYNSHALTVSAS
jgi:hypothetical protein